MATEFTGGKIWVVGKWVDDVMWRGERLFDTFAAANDYAKHDYNHTVEHLFEMAGDMVVAHDYYLKRG